jgi:Trk K+ transport system NAD-binding subunit
MAKGSDLDRVTAIVLREMRLPLIVLLSVNALGIAVMVLIPGTNGEPMGFFHAFYFMTYTATTTGFGELPIEFSDLQRMWATVCLYMSVVAWVYAIGSIIRLVQNPHFTLAIAQSRFARAVTRIREPFFIICGFGDTGSLLARGLSDHRVRAVVIDTDVERIKALGLRDYNVPMPGLEGDASVPKNLQDAGLERSHCRGVVLLTGDDDVNLKIAHEEELIGLGSVVLTDPFETFARELGLALNQPPLHTLDEWLVGVRGVSLSTLVSFPRGLWVLCGYGRMGRWLYQSLSEWGVGTIVVDPDVDSAKEVAVGVNGLATRANLEKAGIASASGVIAATSSDADNLAVLLTARSLNPNVKLIVRQNSHENELAFNAASADLIMQPSLVTARRILLRLISPLIQELLEYLEQHPQILADEVLPRLRDTVDQPNPALWTVRLTSDETPAVLEFMKDDELPLGDLFRDPRNRNRVLKAVPLVVKRGDERLVMPDLDLPLVVDDEVLICSTSEAQIRARVCFRDIYTLSYLVTGLERSRSWLMGSQAASQPVRAAR